MPRSDSVAGDQAAGGDSGRAFRRPAAAAAARASSAFHRGAQESASNPRTHTLFFDITDHDLEGYNKFVPYYLHPESIYSVGLSKSSFRVKVSVGSNPWAPSEPTVNLAKICERYGGGGHARVGAISFGVTEEEAARKAAREIADELRASVCGKQVTLTSRRPSSAR